MNRLALGCLLLGLSVAAPAHAEPLTFGAINGTDDLARSAEIVACRPAPGGRNNDVCLLSRRSFGGLSISSATIALNPAGRARSADIVLDASDYEVAYKLLVGRYGPPTTVLGNPKWNDFDDGATIAISASAPSALISFRFPANDAVAAVARPNPMPIVALSLFVALAFVVGLALRRKRSARRIAPTGAVSNAEPSMRATLERRMRAGEI